jgi:UDP-GlcNAc:undecaprenyl-phosphate GlcNAc-1-phosphate transferase
VSEEELRNLPYILIALVAASIVSFALSPAAIRVAHRIGAIDQPDSDRRIHREPVARAGGWAVAVAFVLVGAAAIWLTTSSGLVSLGRVDAPKLAALLGGVLVAAIIGFIDDRLQIRARWQFAGQIALALIPVSAGITIGFVYNPLAGPGQSNFLLFAPSSGLPALITVLWVVGMINSLNFIDGLDGLSSGIALIAVSTLGVLSLIQGEAAVALLCGVLAGSLAGFLPWNFYPARVFTGTTGVMAVGYALAVLSILGTAKYAVALLVLGVPIIDAFWIIIRRLAHKKSPFTPDRGHVHHRLLDLGLTHRSAVLVIYGICGALAVLSLVLSTAQQMYTFAGFVVGGGLLLLVLTRRRPEPRTNRST